MPNATITSTASTFGTISGTFAADQSTITGTIAGIITGTLDGSVGVPGPQGEPGQGVAPGGTAYQILAKVDGTDYNTEWIDDKFAQWGNVYGEITDQLDLIQKFGYYLPLAGGSLNQDAGINMFGTRPASANTGTTVYGGWGLKVQKYTDITKSTTIEYDGLNVYDSAGQMQVTPTGLTFPDATVQSTAFPGFAGYAPLASPVFTGDARAVTPATSDNDTSIATTAFVKNQAYAPLASPALTGTPTAPTAADGTSSTQIATTAFVQSAIIAGSAHAETLQATVRNNTGATLSPFTVVYINGALGNNATVAKAQANSEATSSGTFAVTQAAISNNADGIVISAGVLSNVNTSAYTDGDKLYLSPTTAGAVTTTKPSAPNHLVYVGVVTRSHPTQGTVSVRIQNGYELDELHDVAISSKTDLDLLAYESSTSLWKNKSFSTLGLAGLASPTFSGTPSLPTGTTATTQTAGDNTTKLATTAFVTAATPSASTTVSGLVELATNADVIVGTSTTLVSPLSQIASIITRSELRSIAHISSTAVSGSGTVTAGAVGFGQREMYLGSLAVGRAAFSYGITGSNGVNMSRGATNQIDFSKKIWLSGKCMCGATASFGTDYKGDTNTFARISLGGYTAQTTGNMTVKGIGWKKQGGYAPYFTLSVHNGTSLTDVASTVQQTDGRTIDWVIYSDGAGNVTLYINGVEAATTASGPTGLSTANACQYREQVEATATPGIRQIIQSTGGWLYIEG